MPDPFERRDLHDGTHPRVTGLAGCYEFRVSATAPAEATVVSPFIVLDPDL